MLIFGAWQGCALVFYPRLDETPGENQPISTFIIRGFATLGILRFANQITVDVIAPRFTEVNRGAIYVNDWSASNCLGPRPPG